MEVEKFPKAVNTESEKAAGQKFEQEILLLKKTRPRSVFRVCK